MVYQVLRKLLKRDTQATPQGRTRVKRWRPQIEFLEDRCLLATFYVAPTGNDAGTGALDSPYRNIQRAVNQAVSGDTILVAGGTYGYSAGNESVFPILGTTGVVSVYNKQLTILGGYAPGFGIVDTNIYPSIIDGGSTVRGVLVLGTISPTSLVLEGFTIQNGFATGIDLRPGFDHYTGFGGGMFVDMAGRQGAPEPFVLRNMVFRTNRAVGNNTDGSVKFGGGSAAGGGAAFRYVTSLTMEGVTFDGNISQGGTGVNRGGQALAGGFHADNTSINGTNLVFTNNQARAGHSNGSGISPADSEFFPFERADALGGAAAIQHNGITTMQSVTATDNLAVGGNAGSAAQNQGGSAFGGAFFSEFSTVTIVDGNLRGNQAIGGNAFLGGITGGGAVETSNTEITIDRSVVIGNRSVGGQSTAGSSAGAAGGGGLYLTGFVAPQRNVVVRNSIIAENLVEIGTVGTTEQGGGGGGIWLQGVKADIVHNTIAGNRFGNDLFFGQAILLIGDGTQSPTNATISFNIISDHQNSIGANAINVRQGQTANLVRNLFANNNLDTNVSEPNPPPGTFIGLDSSLNAPAAGYVSPGTPSSNYHILSTSPAIDQATGSTLAIDIDREPRSGSRDIGADEVVPPQVAFSTASVDVFETAGKVTAVVNRAGNSAGGFSVQFATSNGSAQAGVNYNAASGTLTFGSGETSKSFDITILDDGQAAGNKSFTLTLSNATGGIISSPGALIVNILDKETGASDNALFISGLFHDLLGRSVDQAGLNFFKQPLDAGRGQQLNQVSLTYTTSDEARGKLIDNYYQTYLQRATSDADRFYWVSLLKAGVTPEQAIAQFVSSPEYFQKAGNTNAAWLDKLYQDLLARPRDAASDAFLNALNANPTVGLREQVATSIINSDEYRNRFIVSTYDDLLGRVPSGGEMAYWRSVLGQPSPGAGQPSPHEQFVAGAVASTEFFEKNGNAVTGWATGLYNKVLERAPDSGGLSYAVDLVLGGYFEQRRATAFGIDTSTEYRRLLIKGYFTQFLKREASEGDLTFWVGLLQGGMTDEQVIAKLVGSDEYLTKSGGTNTSFLNQLYMDLLGRARQSGETFFLNLLTAGSTREQVAAQLLASEEYRMVLVRAFFQNYLDRNAGAGDLNYWVQVLGSGLRDEEVLALIIASSEYFLKTHEFP